jgi:uncharacterized SAM-binding protein YcdF (DUF218 family)
MDAVLVPGGGLRPDGTPSDWVRPRLDAAAERADAGWILTLSAGTLHKPPPLDADGFPVYESVAGARYLVERGFSAERILTETASWDTIGNAYFSRVVHVDPLGLERLLVITSEFHMPRVQAIFEWIYGLDPRVQDVQFLAVPDVGLDTEALAARKVREKQSTEAVHDLARSMRSLGAVHRWLFASHDAYAVASLGDRLDIGAAEATY